LPVKDQRRGRKIVWLILDAAGYEITSRCIQAGACPSLAAIQKQGHLGPSRPSEPNCETPPALRALFSGSEPADSGIWGFQMPDYAGRLERSVSGFEATLAGSTAIWDELENSGCSYTLVNTAFRKDPAWGKSYSGFDLLLDGYRNHRPDWSCLRLDEKRERMKLGGSTLHVKAENQNLQLHRGKHLLATLAPGEIRPLQLSRQTTALAYSLGWMVFLFSSSRAHIRLSKNLKRQSSVRLPPYIHHGSLFRYSRDQGGLSIEEEMKLSEYVTAQIGELALSVISELSSTLTIVYFPLIDELSHVYLDQIDRLWPEGRAAELLRRGYRLLDSYIGGIMERLDDDTLLVLSADHGQVPYRRVLHLNDLLAEAGLVHRGKPGTTGGYDLAHSPVYYHPANCGQVIVNPQQARKAGLSARQAGEKVLACLEQANNSLGSEISYLWGEENDPYLLFLYPRSDTHISGRTDGRATIMNTRRKGGQHLSPFCPTPWIQAMLGLWSAAGLPFASAEIPQRNADLKTFLLDYLS
jgi:hypothetical protein